MVRITGLVEKPSPDEAPSDLAIMGRYLLTPEIFDALDRVEPGRGGEIQLTDAIALLMQEGAVYGYVFEHGRYDTGQKLDFLRATIELALERDDLGPDLATYLVELVDRRLRGLSVGLVPLDAARAPRAGAVRAPRPSRPARGRRPRLRHGRRRGGRGAGAALRQHGHGRLRRAGRRHGGGAGAPDRGGGCSPPGPSPPWPWGPARPCAS